jgi:endonuclease/exonuclease/phosphatase family metal-dependent hydrolase
VVVDGRFGEWADVPVLVQDPPDGPSETAVDLGAIHGAADGRHLFFAVETGRPVNAQAMRGTLSILLDTDADPDSGETVDGFPGVDLVVELSRPDQIDERGYGAGMAVREAGSDGTLGERVNASAWDLLVAPTHSTDRFEVRLGRVRREGGGQADEEPGWEGNLSGPSARVRFEFRSGDSMVDRTEPVALTLPPLDHDPPPSWSEALDPAGDLRVLVWNVSSEGIRDRPARFARVMAALEPDVLLLDEVYGDVSEADVRAFLDRQEFAGEPPWDFALGTSGGRQKTVVASRVGIRPEPALQSMPYPSGALERLGERFPEARRLFSIERERGLASVGAWVDVAGRPVLFVPVDLQSAGYDGSFQDELRVLQAQTLRDFIADVLGPLDHRPAIVIGGDLNLVGSRTPLDSLVRELDGNADLITVDAYRLTDRSMATWRNSFTPFTPGRLDFVLFSGSNLSVERSFVFDEGELSDGLRRRLGVEADDSRLAADHLPLVVDFLVTEIR